MKVAVLGTGRMGRGLAKAFARAGHEVVIGSRDPGRAKALAEEVNEAVGRDAARPASGYADAVSKADLVVIAVPFKVMDEVAGEIKGFVRGKVVIDITNPFGKFPYGQTSAQEENAKRLPGARIVAAFKTNFWRTIEEPETSIGIRRDCFIASDDERAKELVMKLVKDLGFNPVDAGPLSSCRALDLMVHLLIDLDRKYGWGAKSSWKLLPP